MPDNDHPRTSTDDNTKNGDATSASLWAAREEALRKAEEAEAEAELALIDRLYYNGEMETDQHAHRSDELFLEEINRLNATLPAAIQTARSVPEPLTAMIDKALNPGGEGDDE